MSKHVGYPPGVTDQPSQNPPFCHPDEYCCSYDVGGSILRRTRHCLEDCAVRVRPADEDSGMTFTYEMAVLAGREAAADPAADERIVKMWRYVPDYARDLLAEAASEPIHPLVTFSTWDDLG